MNRKIPEEEAAARRALVEESRFGWLLRESLEQGYPVEISTTTRKSYVGFVLDEDPQGWERDVAILPVLSGYRDPRNLRFRVTANYADLLSDEMAENYAVAIAMKEIVSIARFDRDVHEKQVEDSGGAE